jgi:hypothetical protein
MAVLEINWNPSSRELRQFAGLCLVIFGGLGTYWYATSGLSWWVYVTWGLAGGVGLTGLALPQAIKWVFVGWIVLAFPIGWTVSHLLLGAIFYFVFTPIGLMLRMSGHDAMRRKMDPSAKSYWVDHEQRTDHSTYFRQY